MPAAASGPPGKTAHAGPAELADSQPFHQGVNVHGLLVHAGDVPQQRDGTGRRREAAVLEHHTYTGPQVGTCRIGGPLPAGKYVRPSASAGLGRTPGWWFYQRRSPPQQGGYLAAFGHKGQPTDYPEHFAVKGGQGAYILNESIYSEDRGIGGSHQSILREVVRSHLAAG